MNTWSRESMQAPPIPPVTQRFGNGLGQEGSTSNLGAPVCAWSCAGLAVAKLRRKPAKTAIGRSKSIFRRMLHPFQICEVNIVWRGPQHIISAIAGCGAGGGELARAYSLLG